MSRLAASIFVTSDSVAKLPTKDSPKRGVQAPPKPLCTVSSSLISGDKPIEITLRVIGSANHSTQLFARGTDFKSSPMSRC